MESGGTGQADARSIEQRVFLGVAAAVILLLLLPGWGSQASPAARLTVLEVPPPTIVCVFPEPKPPEPVVAMPVQVPRIILPFPTPVEVEIPREPLAEPTPASLAAPVAPPGTPHRRSPPPAPGAGPVREGLTGLEKPVLLEAPTADYPVVARLRGCDGVAIVEALIGTDGRVTETRLVRAPAACPELGEAALAAVARRRYEPGRLQGRAVQVIATIRVEFRLN